MEFLRPIKKISGALALITFFVSDCLQPAYAYSQLREFSFLSQKNFEIQIPAELGKVDEVQIVPGSAKTILHIQTAHGQSDAQKNIQRILEYLNTERLIGNLYLEGGSHKLHPELFRFFPSDPERNQKIVEDLIDRGQLTGAEAFLISHPDFKGWGAESFPAYFENWKLFKKVMDQNRISEDYLSKYYQQWKKEADKHLPRKLLNFLDQQSQFNFERISLEAWLEYLKKQAKSELKVDLDQVLAQAQWPFLVRYFRLVKISKDINFDKAQSQKRQFLADLKQQNLPLELIHALRQADSPSPKDSTRQLFERFFEAAPKNFLMEAYPDYKNLIQQKILMEELKVKQMDEEMSHLAQKITERFARTKKQKKFVQSLKNYWIGGKLLRLELSREEYLQIESNKTWKRGVFRAAMQFYQGAIEREKWMAEKLAKRLSNNLDKVAIFVSGGFHSQGIQELLINQRISYVRISPAFSEMKDHSRENYLDSLLGKKSLRQSYIEPVLRTDPASLFRMRDQSLIRSARQEIREAVGAMKFSRTEMRAEKKRRRIEYRERDFGLFGQPMRRRSPYKWVWISIGIISAGLITLAVAKWFTSKSANLENPSSGGEIRPELRLSRNLDSDEVLDLKENFDPLASPVTLAWKLLVLAGQSFQRKQYRVGLQLAKQVISLGNASGPEEIPVRAILSAEKLFAENREDVRRAAHLLYRLEKLNGRIKHFFAKEKLYAEDKKEFQAVLEKIKTIHDEFKIPKYRFNSKTRFNRNSYLAIKDSLAKAVFLMEITGMLMSSRPSHSDLQSFHQSLERYLEFVRSLRTILRRGQYDLIRSNWYDGNHLRPRSELRLEPIREEAGYGKIYEVRAGETALEFAPEFFGHLVSLKHQGIDVFYPGRGSWFMFPWAAMLETKNKKVALPDGTVIDLSQIEGLKWRGTNNDYIAHGLSRMKFPFRVHPAIEMNGGVLFQLDLNTNSIPEIPDYYRDLFAKRSFLLTQGELWIGTSITNEGRFAKYVSFGDHHVFNTPNRAMWKVQSSARKKWGADANGLSTELVSIASEDVYDFTQGRLIANPIYDVVLTGLVPEHFDGDNPFISSALEGPKGEIIQLDQDPKFYQHLVLWTPPKEEAAVGFEPLTSAANILGRTGDSLANPILIQPSQTISTWNRIRVQLPFRSELRAESKSSPFPVAEGPFGFRYQDRMLIQETLEEIASLGVSRERIQAFAQNRLIAEVPEKAPLYYKVMMRFSGDWMRSKGLEFYGLQHISFSLFGETYRFFHLHLMGNVTSVLVVNSMIFMGFILFGALIRVIQNIFLGGEIFEYFWGILAAGSGMVFVPAFFISTAVYRYSPKPINRRNILERVYMHRLIGRSQYLSLLDKVQFAWDELPAEVLIGKWIQRRYRFSLDGTNPVVEKYSKKNKAWEKLSLSDSEVRVSVDADQNITAVFPGAGKHIKIISKRSELRLNPFDSSTVSSVGPFALRSELRALKLARREEPGDGKKKTGQMVAVEAAASLQPNAVMVNRLNVWIQQHWQEFPEIDGIYQVPVFYHSSEEDASSWNEQEMRQGFKLAGETDDETNPIHWMQIFVFDQSARLDQAVLMKEIEDFIFKAMTFRWLARKKFEDLLASMRAIIEFAQSERKVEAAPAIKWLDLTLNLFEGQQEVSSPIGESHAVVMQRNRAGKLILELRAQNGQKSGWNPVTRGLILEIEGHKPIVKVDQFDDARGAVDLKYRFRGELRSAERITFENALDHLLKLKLEHLEIQAQIRRAWKVEKHQKYLALAENASRIENIQERILSVLGKSRSDYPNGLGRVEMLRDVLEKLKSTAAFLTPDFDLRAARLIRKTEAFFARSKGGQNENLENMIWDLTIRTAKFIFLGAVNQKYYETEIAGPQGAMREMEHIVDPIEEDIPVTFENALERIEFLKSYIALTRGVIGSIQERSSQARLLLLMTRFLLPISVAVILFSAWFLMQPNYRVMALGGLLGIAAGGLIWTVRTLGNLDLAFKEELNHEEENRALAEEQMQKIKNQILAVFGKNTDHYAKTGGVIRQAKDVLILLSQSAADIKAGDPVGVNPEIVQKLDSYGQLLFDESIFTRTPEPEFLKRQAEIEAAIWDLTVKTAKFFHTGKSDEHLLRQEIYGYGGAAGNLDWLLTRFLNDSRSLTVEDKTASRSELRTKTDYSTAFQALKALRDASKEADVRDWFRVLLDDGNRFADFVALSIEEDIRATEQFLALVLQKENPPKAVQSPADTQWKIRLVSESPRREQIVREIFPSVTDVQKKADALTGYEEPRPSKGGHIHQVLAISVWKMVRQFLNSESSDREFWVSGDTMLFLKNNPEEKFGKPLTEEKLLEDQQKIMGAQVEAVSGVSLIKVFGAQIQVHLIADRAVMHFRNGADSLDASDKRFLKNLSKLKDSDYQYLDSSKVDQIQTVEQAWGFYRQNRKSELVNQAGGLGIQNRETFVLMDEMIGDPNIIMGFPATLVAHQAKIEGIPAEIPDIQSRWSEAYEVQKILPTAQYYLELFSKNDAHIKETAIREFFRAVRGGNDKSRSGIVKMAALLLWQIRGLEVRETGTDEPSFYFEVMSRYLSQDQKEAEEILRWIVLLERAERNQSTQGQEFNDNALNVATESTPRFEALGQLVQMLRLGDKVSAEVSRVSARTKSTEWFEKKSRIPSMDSKYKKSAMMLLAFEKAWDNLVRVEPKSARYVAAADTRAFISEEKDGSTVVSELLAPTNEDEDRMLAKKMGNREVEAISVVLVSDRKTGEVRFGSGLALLIMEPDDKPLSRPEVNQLHEAVSRQYKNETDPKRRRFLSDLNDRMDSSQPIKVADVREFFRGSGTKYHSAGGLLLQDPVFFTTVRYLIGDPLSAMVFPWQDTVDILGQQYRFFPSPLNDPNKQRETFARINRVVFHRNPIRAKMKYVPTRQLEDIKKKKDFYGPKRDAVIGALKQQLPESSTSSVDVGNLKQDPRFQRIDLMIKASKISLQMVEFRKAAEIIHDIHDRYFMNQLGEAEEKAFIDLVIEELQKKGYEEEVRYWRAFKTAVQYIVRHYPLLSERGSLSITSLSGVGNRVPLGEETEPFDSNLWDYNVADLADQTELFRRLNDVGNLWYRWNSSRAELRAINPTRAVSLLSIRGEIAENLPGVEGRFIRDSAKARYVEVDQYADDKIWRMHYALQKMLNGIESFRERYRPDLNNPDQFWSVYRDLLEKMVASDFDEDFPFRPLTLLQEQAFINDHRDEAIQDMKAALSAGKNPTVAVYFNNAGMESWFNLWQVFLLLKLGFRVSVIVPDAPVLNKDVTDEDIRFMLPYMDQWIQMMYEEDGSLPSGFLAENLKSGMLRIIPVRIDSRSLANLNPGTRDFADQVREDLEAADKNPRGYGDAIRRNMVALVTQHEFNILTGELWYGYFVGMDRLSAAPINGSFEAGFKNEQEAERQADFFIGRRIDSETSLGMSLDSESLIRSLHPRGPNAKGRVLAVHVHKNVRQGLDGWSDGGTNGREKGGLPDPHLTYGSFDAHYFYSKAWRTIHRTFYYRGEVDIAKIIENPQLLDPMLQKFGDAGKFYFGIQEDRMPVKVYDVGAEVRQDPAYAEHPIRSAYDFVYRTATRAVRVRIITYEGTHKFKVERGGKQEVEIANGRMDVQFSVNFEHLLRKSAANGSNGDTLEELNTRYQTWPYTQSKVPTLFLGHTRDTFKAYLEQEGIRNPNANTDLEMINPLALYGLQTIRVTSRNLMAGDENQYQVVADKDADALQLRIQLDNNPPIARMLDVDKIKELYRQSTDTPGAMILRVQVVKKFPENEMGHLFQYLPAWVEQDKDGGLSLVVSIPNVPQTQDDRLDSWIEITDVFNLNVIRVENSPNLNYDSLMVKERPRLFVIRPRNRLVAIRESNDPKVENVQKITDIYPMPAEAIRREILEGRFWYDPAKPNALPKVSIAPIDERQQSDERLAIERTLRAGERVLNYSDLVRVGTVFHDTQDSHWWEYFDFITGLPRLDVSDQESIPVVQLAAPHDVTLGNSVFGNEKDSAETGRKKILSAYRTAAFLAVKNGARALNINMGSAALEMQYSGDKLSGGAGLISRPQLAADIVRAVRQGAHDALGEGLPSGFLFPVSVKTRLGQKTDEELKDAKKKGNGNGADVFDLEHSIDFIKGIMAASPSWIDVHTRTAQDGFSKQLPDKKPLIPRRREQLVAVLNGVRASGVYLPPVFVNGDINGKQDLQRIQEMNEETGDSIHGVMIGRAVVQSKNYNFLRLALGDSGQSAELTPAERSNFLRGFVRYKEQRLGSKFYWDDRILPEAASFFKSKLSEFVPAESRQQEITAFQETRNADDVDRFLERFERQYLHRSELRSDDTQSSDKWIRQIQSKWNEPAYSAGNKDSARQALKDAKSWLGQWIGMTIFDPASVGKGEKLPLSGVSNLDSPHPMDRQIIGREILRLAHEKGWDAWFGNFTAYLALVSQEKVMDRFDLAQQRLEDYLHISPEQTREALWSTGVVLSTHLRHYGPHLIQAYNEFYLDNDLLVEVIRKYIPLLLDMSPEKLMEPLPSSPDYSGPAVPFTYGDLMKWGLRIMLEPVLHSWEFALTDKTKARAKEKWGDDPMTPVVEYLTKMFAQLGRPDWQVEELLMDVLGRSDNDWENIGLRAPSQTDVYPETTYVDYLVDNSQPARLANRVFMLALPPAVERIHPAGYHVIEFTPYKGHSGEEAARVNSRYSVANIFTRPEFSSRFPKLYNALMTKFNPYVKALEERWPEDKFPSGDSAAAKQVLRDVQTITEAFLAHDIQFASGYFDLWLQTYRPKTNFERSQFIQAIEFVAAQRGWTKWIGFMTPYLSYVSQSDAYINRFAEAESVLENYFKASPEINLLKLWSSGIILTFHLRDFGPHIVDADPRADYYLDNELLVGTVQKFIPLMIHLAADNANRILPVTPDFQGQPTNMTFQSMMEWGLRMMLEPALHHYGFGLGVKQFAERKWATPEAAIADYLSRMLKPVPGVSQEQMEDLLIRVLTRTDEEWARLGFRVPRLSDIDDSVDYVEYLLDSSEPQVLADRMFHLALPPPRETMNIKNPKGSFFPEKRIDFRNSSATAGKVIASPDNPVSVEKVFTWPVFTEKFPRLAQILSSRSELRKNSGMRSLIRTSVVVMDGILPLHLSRFARSILGRNYSDTLNTGDLRSARRILIPQDSDLVDAFVLGSEFALTEGGLEAVRHVYPGVPLLVMESDLSRAERLKNEYPEVQVAGTQEAAKAWIQKTIQIKKQIGKVRTVALISPEELGLSELLEQVTDNVTVVTSGVWRRLRSHLGNTLNRLIDQLAARSSTAQSA